jgi:hypothetical protein
MPHVLDIFWFLCLLNVLVSLTSAISVAIKLFNNGALRYYLSTALLISLVFGIILGCCYFIIAKSDLDVIKTVLLVGPLPLWIFVCCGHQTLKRQSKLIGPKEFIVGVGIGILLHGIIVIASAIYFEDTLNRHIASPTKAVIYNLEVALDLYHCRWGTYPIQAKEKRHIINDRTVPGGFGYYQTECCSAGKKSNGMGNNSSLIKVLVDNQYLDPKNIKWNGDNLLDCYGNPIIFRFLVLLDGNNKFTDNVFIWSYGKNGINEVNATPEYKNKGAPVYDSEEAKNIEASKIKDNICSWKNP